MQLEILNCLKRALEEDIGTGDLTTNSIVPADAALRGQIIAKQAGIVAGLDIAEAAARALLAGERTALNFLGRMSGIATLTRKFVNVVSGTNAIILDTRKTAPGLRAIDKLAVQRGGGQNHRRGLFDMILIKDNHIDYAGSLAEAVCRVRDSGTKLEMEVEARTPADVRQALDLGVERILLDNMPVEMMREAVKLNAGQAKLEASGNVTLENVRAIAETGVDYISVGALTHSPRVFDVSFKWIP